MVLHEQKNMKKTTASYVTSKELSVIVFSLTPEIVFVIHGNNYMLLQQQPSITYDCLTIFSTLSYYIITCFHYIMIYFVEKKHFFACHLLKTKMYLIYHLKKNNRKKKLKQRKNWTNEVGKKCTPK